MRLCRPREPSDFWRRAWVNAVDNFSTSFPQAFRISQDRGEGMIIHGGRQWRDYRVETSLKAHLAQHMGVGVRIQGLRRFYAVLLERPDKLLLVRVRDGATTREVPPSLAVFRIAADGKLDFVRKYDVDVGERQMFWMGMV